MISTPKINYEDFRNKVDDFFSSKNKKISY